MKKINILVAALLMSGAAFAQTGQVGGTSGSGVLATTADNAASISQIGVGNNADQTQVGNLIAVSAGRNIAVVEQAGDYNRAMQRQRRSNSNILTVDNANEAFARQDGNNNASDQIQDGNFNDAVTRQNGTGNSAYSEQMGDYNNAAITQTGVGSTAKSWQGVSGRADRNTSIQMQSGDRHEGYIDQDSDRNWAKQEQIGTANYADTKQGGMSGNSGLTTDAQWSNVYQNGTSNRATVNQEH